MPGIFWSANSLKTHNPQVMGVINLSPYSFSAVGRFTKTADAICYAKQLVSEGATIIDIGCEPTNPHMQQVVSVQEELQQLIPVIAGVARETSIPISVDTSRAVVMREAIAQGATLINDVRGFRDPDSLNVVAQTDVGLCIMHMSHPTGKAVLGDNQDLGEDPVKPVKDFLQARIAKCLEAGIKRENIVIDPGIGHGNFGKNLRQNLQLLAKLNEFKALNLPILVGVSRKTFIGELLDLPVAQRLYGSLGAAVTAAINGANIIRTHDVRATVEALKVAAAIIKEKS